MTQEESVLSTSPLQPDFAIYRPARRNQPLADSTACTLPFCLKRMCNLNSFACTSHVRPVGKDPLQELSTRVPHEVQSHRYPELDALRGLAAATVMMFHLLLLWHNSWWYLPLLATPVRLFFAGPQAVILFFTLSGFVLSGPQSRPRHASYPAYLAKRFCRIYLPLLAALLIAFACNRFLYLRSPTDNSWLNATWAYRPHVTELLSAALTSMAYAQHFNTAFWSVFLEVRMSLVFPMLFWAVKRLPFWCSVAATVVLVGLNVLLNDAVWSLLLQTTSCFLAGIIGFMQLPRLQLWLGRKQPQHRAFILLIAVLAYTYGYATYHVAPVGSRKATATANLGNHPREKPEVPTNLLWLRRTCWYTKR